MITFKIITVQVNEFSICDDLWLNNSVKIDSM